MALPKRKNGALQKEIEHRAGGDPKSTMAFACHRRHSAADISVLFGRTQRWVVSPSRPGSRRGPQLFGREFQGEWQAQLPGPARIDGRF